MLNRQSVFCSKNGLCLPIAYFTPMRPPQNYAKQPPKIIENQSLAINKLEVAYSAPT